MPKAHPAVEESVPAPLDAGVVDKKLEEVDVKAAEIPTTNGNGAIATATEEAPVAEPKAEEIPTPEVAEKAVEEEAKEAEKPTEPTPTPVISRAPITTKPAAPAQPAAPPKPLTWASRAAAAAGPLKPAVPTVAKTSTPPAQARAAPPSTPAKPTPTQTTAPPASSAEKEKENSPPTPGGWQTAGSDHSKRQNRPQSISGPPEKEGTMGYVRNVTEKVVDAELKAVLSGFGNLIYFDINRGKVHHAHTHHVALLIFNIELCFRRVLWPRRIPCCCRC